MANLFAKLWRTVVRFHRWVFDRKDVRPEGPVDWSVAGDELKKAAGELKEFVYPVITYVGTQFAQYFGTFWRNCAMAVFFAILPWFFVWLCRRTRPSGSHDNKSPIVVVTSKHTEDTRPVYRFSPRNRRIFMFATYVSLACSVGWAASYRLLNRNPIPPLFFVEQKTLYRDVDSSEFTIEKDVHTGVVTLTFKLDYPNEETLPSTLILNPIRLLPPGDGWYNLDSAYARTNGKLRLDAEGTSTKNPNYRFEQYLCFLKNVTTVVTEVKIPLIPKNRNPVPLTDDDIKRSLKVVINQWDGVPPSK